MNSISLVSVAELLDGRFFFIPAYQRGYRWTDSQMYDLLDDLYEFAIRNKNHGNSNREFYCLQPIIVQKIENLQKLNSIKEISGWDNNISTSNTWEVIDGQQRLTSLYIIFQILMQEGITDEKRLNRAGFELYHICYETRPETTIFLNSLSNESPNNENIDFAFISNAFNAISKWLNNQGQLIAKRYGKRSSPDDILTEIYNLLRTHKDDIGEATGSAQFIWYQIEPDSSKNLIDEFVSINNGKIKLTDAELIKGLILQKHNFEENQESEQMKISLQWENIENILHRNDFWNFLSSSKDSNNRIELLFYLRYCSLHDDEPQDGDLFRFYANDLLSLPPGTDLEIAVKDEWKKILELFNILQEWYEDPIYYNYIGFLIHSGINLRDIINDYCKICGDSPKSDFENILKSYIENLLPSKEEVISKDLDCSYSKKKADVRNLLLFLNIYLLNQQISELRKSGSDFMTPTYKFPFDLYVNQNWDVEHIDSATKNDLREVEEKEEWLRQSIHALNMDDDEEINELFEAKKFGIIWERVLTKSTNSGDESKKDLVGNLTLLDSETNRSYHNKIFALKRAYINSAMNSGKFVPICTQLVFNKSFQKQDTNLREWSDDDKNLYTEFILSQLSNFYNINNSKQPELPLNYGK